jgi:hypothetical protein
MRQLACLCGQTVYFENHRCARCGRKLAFDPAALNMASEPEPGAGLPFCPNREGASRCNWLRDPGPAAGPCIACRSSEVIPALSKPENRGRWRKLEQAKRRLIYDLLGLGLPVDASRLRFVFKEDQRTNPDVHEEHVSIGHSQGVITINAAEADDVYREQMRQLMNEPYRTLLGHFRHEAGHYYFDLVVDDELRQEARRLFGDESVGYDEALRRHYQDGPQLGWEQYFITSYASAHPAEDWAETFAHFLHIRSALETAGENGLTSVTDLDDWQRDFIALATKVNDVMRSLGLGDAYPFVITATVAEKIDFVRRAIRRFTDRPVAPSSAAG